MIVTKHKTTQPNQGYPTLYYDILTPLVKKRSLPSDSQRRGGTRATRVTDEGAYSLPSSSFVLLNLRTQPIPERTIPGQRMCLNQRASTLVQRWLRGRHRFVVFYFLGGHAKVVDVRVTSLGNRDITYVGALNKCHNQIKIMHNKIY